MTMKLDVLARPPKEPQKKSAARAFLWELGMGLLATPVFTLALLLVAVFFEVAADMSEALWQGVIAFAVVIAVAVLAASLVGFVALGVVGPAAVGWLGWLTGQRPREFGPEQHNGARALVNLLVFALCSGLGVLLFRHGVNEGQMNWAILGLFLTAGGTVFGLGSAVPRLVFFARGHRNASSKEGASSKEDASSKGNASSKARVDEAVEGATGIAVLVVAATLGLGLSLGVSMAFSEAGWDTQRARVMRPKVWHKGCVSPAPTKKCQAKAELLLVAKKAGFHRVDLGDACSVLILEKGDSRPVVAGGWPELRRLGVRPVDVKSGIKTRLVRLAAGQRIRVVLTPAPHKAASLDKHCVFKVRYSLVEEVAP